MESGRLVVIGAAIGVMPTLIVGWLNQRAEKEKHLRQLAVEMALAEHKMIMDLQMRSGNTVHAMPPTTFIAPAFASVTKIMNCDIRAEDIPKGYAEISEVIEKNKEGIDKIKGPTK